MARYKPDQRKEYQLLPGSLDEMLPEDSVARGIAAILERLDFACFDGNYKNDEAGCTAINPRSLAGVIILGVLRGRTSSVQLAVLCQHQIEYRWLAGGVRIEKSTLCDFRKNHLEELVAVSTEVLHVLGQHRLLPGENMGVDGSIVRAAASRHSSKKRKHLKKAHAQLEQVVRDKLESDDDEEGQAEAGNTEKRRNRLARALEEMTQRGLDKDGDRLTVTEPDAGLKRQKDGAFAPGYNAQVVSDLDSGIIVSAEIIEAGNDCGQLQPQLEQAQAALEPIRGQAPDAGIRSCTADGAYHDTRQLHELEGAGIECYVPDARNTHRKAPGIEDAYQADAFNYDEATDSMRCPEGQRLPRRKANAGNTATVYEAPAKTCAACPAKDKCCPKTKGGRSVNRTLDHYQATLDQVAARLDTEAGHHRLNARWITCEGVFARLNEHLHWRRNRMWGLQGAKAELAWRVLTHNLLLLARIWRPMTSPSPGS